MFFAGRAFCPLLIIAAGSTGDIANLMEVVVVDVNDLGGFWIVQSVGNWPADNGFLGEIDSAFVMSVVQLGRTD